MRTLKIFCSIALPDSLEAELGVLPPNPAIIRNRP